MFVAGGGSWLAVTGSDRTRRDAAQLVCARGYASSTGEEAEEHEHEEARGRHVRGRRRGGRAPGAAMFVAGVGRSRGSTGRGPGCLAPNFPYVLSAATMDPIVAHGWSSSEEWLEIEEIDEGQKCHFPLPVYAVRSSWRAMSAKMARMYQTLYLDGKYKMSNFKSAI